MLAKIRNLIVFLFVLIFTLNSCRDEEGAPRMLWEVSATPEQNVNAEFYPDYHPQLNILTNNEEGEAMLVCTNYKSLRLHYPDNNSSEIITDPELKFTAKVVDGNKIRITFEKLPESVDVSTDAFLKIDGSYGTYNNMTVAKITRMP